MFIDKISVLENLSTLINTEALYVVHNQIQIVDNLSALVNLRVLELGDNRIKVSFVELICLREMMRLFLEN
jgi:Leucine-rich repeat (LRR) protein